MLNTKCKKFKGEIENYLRNSQNQFECKIDRLFTTLKVKTWLCILLKKTDIRHRTCCSSCSCCRCLSLKIFTVSVVRAGNNGHTAAKMPSTGSNKAPFGGAVSFINF